ncbi:MAG TPA: flagellar hook-associated protein FlgL [Phycisphaerae bacterium]|nr:flagellar hook-associated protein FlgL [Phycisphaerae bacterium]
MSGWGTIFSTTQAMLRQHAEQLAQLQETVASGARLRRASDAPVDAFRLLGLRTESRSLQTYGDNLTRVSDSLNVTSSVLSKMSETLTRVRELVTQGVSGTYSAANRKTIADEINSLLEQLVSLANTKHGGQRLFGGSHTGSAPYTTEYENGRIVRVTYEGSRQAVMVPVAPGVEYSGVLVGDDIFGGDSRRAPQFFGNTGAAGGVGTSSVTNDVWLTVSHESTTYLGASGMAPGTSSAAADTILGDNHTLTIDAPNKTLRLDGGPEVTFSGGETNLVVANNGGDVAYVDVTALGGAFVGTVGIQTTGSLSIDDGASQTATDFTNANLAVTDSVTGRVLYVDGTGIERSGLEPVRTPGTYDMFGALVTVRDLMLNTRNMSESKQLALLGEMVDSVTEVTQGLTVAEMSVGARIGVLATLGENLDNIQTYTDDQAASLEDADIVQVVTELARRQMLYEVTLASASKLLQLSLFDYI